MNFLIENRKYIGLGGCVLAIIGCFLPFASVYGMTASYINGDGKILLIAMIVSAVLIYLQKDNKSLISSGIGGILFLFSSFRVFSTSSANIEIGLILIFIGLAGAIAYPFLKEKNNVNK